MKRFLVFPFVLGVCGALLFTFCFAQFAVVVFVGVSSAVSNTNPRLLEMRDLLGGQIAKVFLSSYMKGILFGAIAGLFLALWDKARNGAANKNLLLPQNVFWCLCYALLFSIPHHAFGLLYLYGYTSMKFFGVLPLVSLLTLNFTAISWAAIRSITTTDVLTPRVLREKIRQRSRLQ